jgi:RES domain-containing protein
MPPKSPLTEYPWRSAPATDGGRLVRDVASEFQAAWAESSGLRGATDTQRMAFMFGVAALASADADGPLFGSVYDGSGKAELILARTLLDVSQGFVSGFAAGVRDAANLIPAAAGLLRDLATNLRDDPQSVLDAIGRLPAAVPRIAAALQAAGISVIGTLRNGTAAERAELMGRVGFEVLAAMATGGTVDWLRASAGGAMLASRLNPAGQLLFSAAIDGVRPTALASVGAVWLRQAERFGDVTARTAFVALSKAAPEHALSVAGAYTKVLVGSLGTEAQSISLVGRLSAEGASNTASFVDRFLLARADPRAELSYITSFTDVERVATRYASAEAAIAKLPSKSVDVQVWRTVPPEITVVDEAKQTVRVIKNSEETVFNMHDGLTSSRSRFGLAGEEGVPVMSGAIGDKTSAWAVSFDEVDSHALETLQKAPDTLILASKNIRAGKVLDLTDASVRDSIGVSFEDLTLPRRTPGSYEWTQIIGDAARRHEFDAIIAPSAVSTSSGSVIHILNPEILK